MSIQDTTFAQIHLFHKIIRDPKLIKHTPTHFFDVNNGIGKLFEIIKENKSIWSNVTSEQIKNLLKEKNIEINPDAIDSIMKYEYGQVSDEWLEEKYRERLLYTNLYHFAITAVTDLKLLSGNPTLSQLQKLENKLRKHVLEIKVDENNKWDDLLSNLTPDDGIPLITGHKRFDDWQAIRKKRITCFIGKTGGLKTKSLINIAASLIKNGYKVAYISFEVEQGEIQRQLLCQLFSITRKELELLSYEELVYMWDTKCPGCKPALLFYDSYNSYNSNQLLGEILSKETPNDKFDAIIVDYLSIIDSPLEDMYSKGKKISQDFASFAKSYNWSIITAAQTNRSGLSKIINTVDDVAESTGLLHTFDFIISIIHYKRLIKSRECVWHMLKARYVNNNNAVGSKTAFSINWNNEGIFTEVVDKRNKEIIKTINRDDTSGTFGDDDDEDEPTITAQNYNPSDHTVDITKITGKDLFK